MVVECFVLVRQDVSIRDNVKGIFAETFLHLHHIEAESVLPGNFVTGWEVINLLVFVQSFIQITLTARRAPQNIPFMTLCIVKLIGFKQRSNQFGISSQYFVE